MPPSPESKYADFFSTPRGQKLSSQVARAVVVGFVERGRVNPKGKSEVEILKEVCELLKNQEISLITDHRSDLLKKAREAKANEEYDVACIFYATWFEHAINGALDILLERKGISKKDAAMLMSGCNAESKVKVILPLLGFPKMDDRHLKAFVKIRQERNAFIHYKFTPSPNDLTLSIDADDALKAALDMADKGCIYIQKMTTRFFTSGQSRKLKKLLKD